jgi:hypothetical protein
MAFNGDIGNPMSSAGAREEMEQVIRLQQAYAELLAAEKQAIASQARKIRSPFIGIDPAKPGSDIVSVWEYRDGAYRPMSPKPESCPIADAAFPPTAPSAPAASLPSFDVDHAWDMVVLAARTSRYGE